ncbi:MAG: hypothetical protein QOD11_1414 [Bradyrhizobium sp.]|jgi:hypothetical protein|nr:hypothetical protein [Bradyrhizobium sp.]
MAASSVFPRTLVAEQAAMAAEYDWHRDPQTPIFYPQQALVS